MATALVTRPEVQTEGFGIVPKNWADAWAMAQAFADSELVPKHYQKKPADVLVAMQYGAEIGLSPMAALTSIAVINGRPTVWGDGFLAVLQASPAYVKHKEYFVNAKGEPVDGLAAEDFNHDEVKAVSMFWRRGIAEPFTWEFSIAKAKKANLWKKQGPWTEYPDRMMLFRAREYAGRNGFSDVLKGLQIGIPGDTPPEEITTSDSPTPSRPPLPQPKPAEPTDEFLTNELPEPGEGASSPQQTRSPQAPLPLPSSPSSSPQARRPAKPSAAAQTFEGFRVTKTEYVAAPSGKPAPYTKVEARSADKPLAYTFVTRDSEIAEIAASIEGDDKDTYKLTWEQDPEDKKVKVLVGIVKA